MTPRLCLNMIVRNEAAIIERALASVLPIVSCYEILDTGSADDTVDRIRRFFAKAGVPGTVHHGRFDNFGQARNDALALCRASSHAFDYILLADADMQLEILDPAPLESLSADAYLVRQRNTISYLNVRLLRRSLAARYVGVTHEYLDLAGGNAETLDAIEFNDYADGANRPEKFARDIALLSAHLAQHPDDPRSLFYLAQSYRDAGRLPEAIATYARRVAVKGWQEESWYAQYQLALCQYELGNRAAFVAGCLAAYDQRPWRAEPLHALARHYREQNEHQSALLFAAAAALIPYPAADALFIDDFVYRTGCTEELAISGYYGTQRAQRRQGALACNSLALARDCPDANRSLARNNLLFYAQSAAELFGPVHFVPLALSMPAPYVAMNPSIAALKGELYAIARSVNYMIADNGAYAVNDELSRVRTRNWFLRVDAELNAGDGVALLDNSGRAAIVDAGIVGFEDCRLFRWRDAWWASATVRDEDPAARAEMVLLQFDELGAINRRWRLRGFGGQAHQKNWMPCVRGDELLFVYGCDPVLVLKVARFDSDVAEVMPLVEQKPAVAVDHLRGGSQLVAFDDGWLAVTHEVVYAGPARHYLHRLAWFDERFALRRLSMPFFLRCEGIEFVAGLAKLGDDLVMSFGVRDAEAYFARVAASGVRTALLDV